jgi:hypothetical protein
MATREFARLKVLADGALAQVPPDRYFTVLSEGGNSVATIVKHLGGNMRSRWTDFLTTDGEKPWRDRDREFELDGGDSREALQAQWEEGWRVLFAALSPLRAGDEERVIVIRGESMTVSQAIHRQLTHYAYHVGQLVFLAKHFAADEWKTLSVPRGGSKQFNAAPETYIATKNRTSST